MDTTQTRPPLPKMSHPNYEPKEGDVITVELPDERTRATIVRIISDTAVIAKIMQYTTGRHSHPYKKDDLIACKFETLDLGNSGWRVLSDRELEDVEPAAEVAPPPPAAVPTVAKKKKGK